MIYIIGYHKALYIQIQVFENYVNNIDEFMILKVGRRCTILVINEAISTDI